jgi:serine/threonine-protein kinase
VAEVRHARPADMSIGLLVGRWPVSDELSGDAGASLTGMAASLDVGSRLAGYRLQEQIGRGGMALVFRAVDERLGRPVALKILAPKLADDEEFRQRFIRESRTAAAVDDPHIIPVHDAGEAGGKLFIAMRYVPGGDVRTLLHREGPLPPARTAAIISPVASALDAAHAAGLVHRDVKPANMLLDVRPDRPDHVYLSDFGLCKSALSTVGLTRPGQVPCTPDYTAPEQIKGLPLDGRTDQYALACTAFELLTGQAPFHRELDTAVMYAHMQEPPPPLSSRRRGLPAAADQVFARALAKVPGNRYASCREFADALRQALGQAPYHSVPRATPTVAPPPDTGPDTNRATTTPERKRRWTGDWTTWTLILALSVCVGGSVLWGISPDRSSANYVGLALFCSSLLAALIALIVKLSRRLRRLLAALIAVIVKLSRRWAP